MARRGDRDEAAQEKDSRRAKFFALLGIHRGTKNTLWNDTYTAFGTLWNISSVRRRHPGTTGLESHLEQAVEAVPEKAVTVEAVAEETASRCGSEDHGGGSLGRQTGSQHRCSSYSPIAGKNCGHRQRLR